MFLSSDVFTIFIHSLRRGRTDGDILWWYEVKMPSGGYLAHGGEGIGGKELWLWLSEVQIEPNMEEKGIVVTCGLRRIDDPKAGRNNGMSERRVYFFFRTSD